LKIFISQKMGNLTLEEILKRRSEITEFLETQFKDFEIINSIIEPTEEHNSLWYLGKSIELLSEADLAVFDTGWYNSRGCLIEFKCCNLYGIKMLFI